MISRNTLINLFFTVYASVAVVRIFQQVNAQISIMLLLLGCFAISWAVSKWARRFERMYLDTNNQQRSPSPITGEQNTEPDKFWFWLHDDIAPWWCDAIYPIGTSSDLCFTAYLVSKADMLEPDQTLFAISINRQEPATWYPCQPKSVRTTMRGIEFSLETVPQIIPWPSHHA